MPIFYHSISPLAPGTLSIDADTSRHAVQVLRMVEGDRIRLTDGYGKLADAVISLADKKSAVVSIDSIVEVAQPSPRITLGVSVLKNSNRIEWLFEKATEIGVTEIVPLLCDRTEKEKFRKDRMEGILISAMLQSQQTWLPVLHEPITTTNFFSHQQLSRVEGRFIAHCMEGKKIALNEAIESGKDVLLLIGPEGDFTPRELQLAIDAGYIPVSLGNTRLRTETAGLVGVALMKALSQPQP